MYNALEIGFEQLLYVFIWQFIFNLVLVMPEFFILNLQKKINDNLPS